MTPQQLLDKATQLIELHLFQIEDVAVGKGFTATDAAVIERYTKLLIALTKAPGEDNPLEHLSDEELLQQALGDDNVDAAPSPPE